MILREIYSRLWDDFETDKLAQQARNKRAKELQGKGHKVVCWTQYTGLGQPDGRVCSVYMLDVYESDKE